MSGRGMPAAVELPRVLAELEAAGAIRVEAEHAAVFHRIQEGYPDGWPRAVFVDSEGEPSGVRCQPEEAAAIEAGALALIEVAALRSEVERLRAAQEGVVAAWGGVVAKLGDLGSGWDGDDSAILQDRVNDMKAALAKAVRS